MNFKPSRSSRVHVGLDMTSMIDVIFLLLIYFLLTTTYAPPESHLAPALRVDKVAAGRIADLQPQIIDVEIIDGSPGFRLGDQVLRDKESLRVLLAALPKDAGVFVKGAGDVATEWAVAALQACRDAGFDRVTYVPRRR